jgi:LmbE family N-acetylglucosaminyl deacetylase
MVSVTDGGAGHHQKPRAEMAAIRRREAAASGRVLGAVYETWDFPDGELLPTLEVRRRIIAEIRSFAPDLVLTHRTSDYHPDHRAVGQAVQDASFLVTVPHVVPGVPPLERDPVVAYMVDLFTKPCPLAPDVVIDVTDQVDTIVAMLACHASQVFEWLPYLAGLLDRVPEGEEERRAWLRAWFTRQVRPRAERFRDALVAAYGPKRGSQIEFAEVYEISEYAAAADATTLRRLFPQGA